MQFSFQLLEHFSKAVLHSEPSTYSPSESTSEREQQLVWAMSQNYRNMFRVPVDLQREVELHLHKERNRQARPTFSLVSFSPKVIGTGYEERRVCMKARIR